MTASYIEPCSWNLIWCKSAILSPARKDLSVINWKSAWDDCTHCTPRASHQPSPAAPHSLNRLLPAPEKPGNLTLSQPYIYLLKPVLALHPMADRAVMLSSLDALADVASGRRSGELADILYRSERATTGFGKWSSLPMRYELI